MSRRGSATLSESLDEENRKILARLQQDSPRSSTQRTRDSPTPQSHYARDTLGVDPPTPRHGSIAGIGVGVTSPTQVRKQKLDPSDPSTWTRPHNTASPVDPRPRSSSDTYGQHVPKILFSSSSDVGREADTQDRMSPAAAHSPADRLSDNIASVHLTKTPNTQEPYVPTHSERESNQAQSVQNLAPSPASLDIIEDKGHKRRTSNQSASFSTVTDDSDRIAAIPHDDNMQDEDALHDSSSEERSESDPDDGSPVAERGRNRKSQRDPVSADRVPSEIQVSPEIKVDEAESDRDHIEHSGPLSETQGKVVPRSNYRSASPAALSSIGDDDAELKRAKAMELRISPIDEKIKDRTVKMIIRGDWAAFQDHENDEQEYRHEPRFYLVCSDLSNEASYALEWTVGTLLKDGDTLLLLSAFEDENAAKHKDHEEPSLEVKLESAKAAEEANSTMDTLTRQTTNLEGEKPAAAKSHLGTGNAPRSRSRSSRPRTRRDEDRIKAIEKLETDFLRYVRKTALQVRCMFEVIHCRSPRHLVLNAIDELEPTLAVVGTRGLSSVKGVMLGSFSNYLVQKSSVPVMVARKRLKKARGAKVSSNQIRMTNNLMPFSLSQKRKSLTQARID